MQNGLKTQKSQKHDFSQKCNIRRFALERQNEGRETQFFLLEITRDYQRLLKITRITGLPEITKITMRLLKITKITKDYQGLPGITKDYQGISRDYQGLPWDYYGIFLLEITRDYQRLPKITRITRDYQGLP